MVLRLSVKYRFPNSIFVGQDSLKMELLTNWVLTKWQGLSCENQSLYRPNVFQSNVFRAKVAELDKCSVLSSAKQLLFLIGTIISFIRKKYQSRPLQKYFCFCIVVSKVVRHCQSLPPKTNICGQGMPGLLLKPCFDWQSFYCENDSGNST